MHLSVLEHCMRRHSVAVCEWYSSVNGIEQVSLVDHVGERFRFGSV